MKISLLAPLVALPLFVLTASAAPVRPAASDKPTTAAPTKAGAADPLGIPTFAEVPGEFEFSGTQKDLLGVLQGLAHGAKIEGAKPVSPNMNGEVRLFSDAELLDMVSEIHVLRAHSLSFKALSDKEQAEFLKIPFPPPAGTMSGGTMSGGTMSGGTMSGGAMPGGTMSGGMMSGGTMPGQIMANPVNADEMEQARLAAAQKFYADLFLKQGGKAQLSLRGETSIAVYVFESPRSFALLTRGPSRVIVVRADGMPRLSAIGRLFRQVVSQ